MLGFRVDVYDGAIKVAEVRTPAMAFGLLAYTKEPRLMVKGRVLYNVATDGPVQDINQYAAIIAPRWNEIRFGAEVAV